MSELENDEANFWRQSETFRRIHRLYKHGFRPDWSVKDVEDALWWRHPGGYPELILYPDGKLVAVLERAELNPSAKFDKDRIFNLDRADATQFDRWLASVKPPTWWQSGAMARERYILVPVFVMLFYGVMALCGWGVDRLLRAAWRAIFG